MNKARFRLSTLLVALTVVAIALGFTLQRTHCQTTALQVARLGGSFEIESRGSDWLRRTFGYDPYNGYGEPIGPMDRLTEINLGIQGGSRAPPPSGISNAELNVLNGSSYLTTLSLSGTKVTDLTSLAGLPKLRVLNLSFTSITKESLQHLGSFPSLSELLVRRTRMGDAEIETLSQLPDLQLIDVSNNAITDKCVVHLAQLHKLRVLIVDNTNITSEGITQLQQELPQVEVRQRRTDPYWQDAP
jgi:hypothetical protein